MIDVEAECRRIGEEAAQLVKIEVKDIGINPKTMTLAVNLCIDDSVAKAFILQEGSRLHGLLVPPSIKFLDPQFPIMKG